MEVKYCHMIEQFFRAVRTNAAEQKRSAQETTPLSEAEIKFLHAVHKHPQLSSVLLAEELEVSRAAVTQWGNRLEKMGYVSRVSRENNKKEKAFVLTDAGEAERQSLLEENQAVNQEMCRYLRGLKEEERKAILSFLQKVSDLAVGEFECFCQNPNEKACICHFNT